VASARFEKWRQEDGVGGFPNNNNNNNNNNINPAPPIIVLADPDTVKALPPALLKLEELLQRSISSSSGGDGGVQRQQQQLTPPVAECAGVPPFAVLTAEWLLDCVSCYALLDPFKPFTTPHYVLSRGGGKKERGGGSMR